MAEGLAGTNTVSQLRRLVAQERVLIKEKAALEQMLSNVQALRNKLKVEQMQLSGHLQDELGGTQVVQATERPVPDYMNIEQEESNIAANKPTLNLNVDNFQRILFGRDDEDEEEDEDYSDNDGGCAQEVMGETEIDFDDF